MIGFPLPAPLVAAVLFERTGTPAYAFVPRDHPSVYYRVAARGGSRRSGSHGQISQRIVQVYTHAATIGVAMEHAEKAAKALIAAGYDPTEKRLRATSLAAEPAESPDPETGAPRATMTVLVTLRGTTE